MFKNTKNKVARTLKIYSILNAIGGIVVGIAVANNTLLYEEGGIAAFLICLVASFGIFAFGEVVDLLDQIKRNTEGAVKMEGNAPSGAYDDLPEL